MLLKFSRMKYCFLLAIALACLGCEDHAPETPDVDKPIPIKVDHDSITLKATADSAIVRQVESSIVPWEYDRFYLWSFSEDKKQWDYWQLMPSKKELIAIYQTPSGKEREDLVNKYVSPDWVRIRVLEDDPGAVKISVRPNENTDSVRRFRVVMQGPMLMYARITVIQNHK